MNHLKIFSLAALSAMALVSIAGTGTASATTLEVGGVTKNESVTITMSLKSGTSSITEDTFGFSTNTCTGSHVHGKTEKNFTTVTTADGTKHHPTGALTDLTFTGCEHTVTVHAKGKLYLEWTSGTNGRVYSEEAEVTEYLPLPGTHINCTTGAGTPIGTLTGVKEGHATMTINAALTCGPHIHSLRWTATYTVTSPTGLGVSP